MYGNRGVIRTVMARSSGSARGSELHLDIEKRHADDLLHLLSLHVVIGIWHAARLRLLDAFGLPHARLHALHLPQQQPDTLC